MQEGKDNSKNLENQLEQRQNISRQSSEPGKNTFLRLQWWENPLENLNQIFESLQISFDHFVDLKDQNVSDSLENMNMQECSPNLIPNSNLMQMYQSSTQNFFRQKHSMRSKQKNSLKSTYTQRPTTNSIKNFIMNFYKWMKKFYDVFKKDYSSQRAIIKKLRQVIQRLDKKIKKDHCQHTVKHVYLLLVYEKQRDGPLTKFLLVMCEKFLKEYPFIIAESVRMGTSIQSRNDNIRVIKGFELLIKSLLQDYENVQPFLILQHLLYQQ